MTAGGDGKLGRRDTADRVARMVVRATREAAAGRLWKAKELLHRAVQRAGFDQDLYERYGLVLLSMGDLPEAGRWLFLSGKRPPEYAEAIGLFVRRYTRKGWAQLYHAFPPAARLGGPGKYPPPLDEELRKLGLPDEAAAVPTPPGRESILGGVLSAFTCGGCFLYAAVSGVVGAIVVGEWVVEKIAGLFK